MANNVTDLGKVGMTPKGAYNSASTYERLDVVTYEGSSYVSLVDSNTNNNPSTATNKWQLMAAHGEFTEAQLEEFKAAVVAESKEEMDDYTDEKKAELDTYEDTKETELNTYATELKDDFDTNATAKTTAFNENAASKTTDFNTNAGNKTNTFDTNASTKTTAFNDNATSKTTTFNTNATNKTTDFDTNATNKTNDFNDNASDKTDDFNDNATAKTIAFDEHVDDKTDEFDEHTEEMQQEIDELSANMPWAGTEQATEIQVTDAAKYSKNKLELYGNTSQDSTTGINLLNLANYVDYSGNGINLTINPDKSFKVNGTATSGFGYNKNIPNGLALDGDYTFVLKCTKNISQNTLTFTLETGSAIPDTNIQNLKANGINITNFTLENVTATQVRCYFNKNNSFDNSEFQLYLLKGTYTEENLPDYEIFTNGASPNPDYPQDIHVVTGNNTIKENGKNLLDWNLFEDNDYIDVVNKTPKILSLTGKSSYYTGAYILLNLKPNTQYVVQALVTAVGTNSQGKLLIYDKNYDESGMLRTANRIATSDTLTTEGKVSCTFTTDETGIIYIVFQCNSVTNNGSITYEDIQLEEGQVQTSFEPYYHVDYPINLGSLELCKIGDYQDYLYKENGNWYKYGAIDKYVYNNDLATNSIDENNVGMLTPTLNIKPNLLADELAIMSYSNLVKPKRTYYTGLFGTTSSSKIRLQISVKYATTYDEVRQLCANNNLTIYFGAKTPVRTQITDTTLISQLEAIYEHLQLTKGANNITVTASDLAPYMELTYMQDLPTKLNNLVSRIELLEE